MTQLIRWVAPDSTVTDLSERVDNGDDERFAVTANAEECSIASSTILLRDPDGDFGVVGLNRIDIQEEDSLGTDPFIWNGRAGERREYRGEYRTGAARMIEVTLEDHNVLASNYIVGDTEDGNRPAEDHGERIEWLLGTDACFHLTDTSLVLITTAKAMEAYDYTGMTPQQVIDDCARASGYDNFIWHNGVTDESGLVYAKGGGTWLTSDLRLSNVVAEVDDETTFYLNLDAELRHDPTRVASRVFGRGDGIDGVRTNDVSEDLHARRDVAMDWPTVKTMATLNDRMDRALAQDLSTEEWVLKGSVLLPSTVASQFKAGYRVEVHATHLTHLQEGFAWVRLLNTTHRLIAPTLYQVEFEAEVGAGGAALCAGSEYAATPSGSFDPLNTLTTPEGDIAYYWRSGIDPPEVPTPDFVGNLHFPELGSSGTPDAPFGGPANRCRFVIVGAGTLTVSTAVWGGELGGAVTQSAILRHSESTFDDTVEYDAGDDFVLTVSTHGGTECVHWVDMAMDSSPSDHSVMYAGATWVSAE